MYIKKIEITNIKKHEYKEIEFKNGLNFISGRNGAGKTTIIESIGFVLFNYMSSIKNFSSYFIRKGQKKGEVKAYIIDKNGNNLIVDRKISLTSAGNSWSITREGEDIALVSGNVEVMEYLKENLEFYPDDNITDIYSNIISVPQGEFTQAFFYSEQPRKDVFDPIFKLDTYKRAYNNIKLTKNLDDKINELIKQQALLIGEVKEYDVIVENLSKKKEEVEITEKELKKLEKLKQETEKKYNEINKKKESINKLNVEKQSLNLEYEKKKTLYDIKLKELEELKSIKKELETSKKEYDSYVKKEKQIEIMEETFKELSKNKELYDQKIQGIEKGKVMIEERENSLKIQKEDIVNEDKKEIELKNKIDELEKQILKYNESNKNEENNNEDIKNISNDMIEKMCAYSNLLKQIEMNLKLQTTPGKGVMYLNSAKNHITNATKKASNDIVPLLDSAKENIDKVIKLENAQNDSFVSVEKLVEEKEELEASILSVYNKCMKTNLDKIDDIENMKKEFLENINKNADEANKQIEIKTKLSVEIEHSRKTLVEITKSKQLKNERFIKESQEKEKWIKGIEEYKNIVDSLEDKVKEYNKIKLDLDILREEIKKNRDFYDKYVLSMKKLEKEAELTNEINILNGILENDKNKLKEILNAIEEISKDFNDEQYEKLRLEYEENNTKYSITNERFNHILNNYNELNEKKKYLDNVRENINKLEEEIRDYKEVSSIVSKLRQVIKVAPDEISSMLVKNISLRANDIYSDISLDSSRLEWENSYEVALYDYIDNKEIRKTFKELSGGEQMTAALAIRIAMLEILTNLKIGILDEPTINMDTVRREKLSEIIGQASEKFTQLLVVSHDDTFENITQNVISLN